MADAAFEELPPGTPLFIDDIFCKNVLKISIIWKNIYAQHKKNDGRLS